MACYSGRNAQILIGASIATATAVGAAESASLEITTGLEPYNEIGEFTPYCIAEGNQEITGSISRMWIDLKFLNYLRKTSSDVLSEFFLIFRAGTSAGSPYIYAKQCKAETVSIDISQDGFVMNDIDFRALEWDYGSVP
jgi:hypothetical protein